jgi:hypothetical protein
VTVVGPPHPTEGLIELKDGMYPLDAPLKYIGKKVRDYGVPVRETNKGKNAFRFPNTIGVREWLEGYLDEGAVTNDDVINHVMKQPYARGMELFFRRGPVEKDRRNPLYVVHPSAEGVADFARLCDAELDRDNHRIKVPVGQDIGFWLGRDRGFINTLSKWYGKQLEIESVEVAERKVA